MGTPFTGADKTLSKELREEALKNGKGVFGHPTTYGSPPPFEARIVSKEFRVGETGSSKYPRETLLRLFHLWQKQYLSPGDVPIVPPNHYPEQGYFKIFQARPYEGAPCLATSRTSGNEVIALVLDDSRKVVDDQEVYIYYFEAGKYQYTSVIGATRTVRRVREWTPDINPSGNGLSQADFTSILRNKKRTLIIYDVESIPCPLCHGKGSLRGEIEKGKSPDRWYPCPNCDNGTERIPVRWVVSW
jgi:hypothetical protein